VVLVVQILQPQGKCLPEKKTKSKKEIDTRSLNRASLLFGNIMDQVDERSDLDPKEKEDFKLMLQGTVVQSDHLSDK